MTSCHDDDMTRCTSGLVLALALVFGACSGGDDETGETSSSTIAPTAPVSTLPMSTGPTDGGSPAEAATTTRPAEPIDEDDFTISAGTEQITITDAEPGRRIDVFDAAGAEVGSGIVDDNGVLIVRDLDGGADYVVGDETTRSAPVTTLHRDDHPAAAFFVEQRLPTDGMGYITTRDGTTLSASTWLPGPADDGPYPTVVEYSGYDPSDPDATGLADVFTALGYAYVGVNIRGTGCSGGSFNYFEYTQSLDGYDAIETVAAQPWVQGGRVGMAGFSYPGISQLFVAQTHPPHLAAITPSSVIADTALSTLYPGGILNIGFAVPWAQDRIDQGRPEGSPWVADRVTAGDETCAANQLQRLQNPDLLELIDENRYWTDEVAADIAPRLFVDQITVPTFVAGTWQDEQTGGHFPTMLDRFTGTQHLYVTLTNGLHADAVGPALLPRLIEFLDLYVAERTPSLGVARLLAPVVASALYGTADVSLPPDDRFSGLSYDEALALFEAEPSVRILFEQGAADGAPARAPMSRFEAGFEAWPVPDAAAKAWYLDEAGVLADEPAVVSGDVSYLALPDATPATWYEGSSSGIWSVDVTYDWRDGGAGSFADWVTEPLTDDTVIAGSGSVDLWMRSDVLSGPAADTDVEVTITEVRPDGQELYIQSGWLRASQRALDEAASTELRPVHTHREDDAEPLPEDQFALVRVELFPFAHAFRSGSRIRLIVDAPGGQRPVWEFQTISGGEAVTIAHGGELASRVILPVVDGVDVPDEYPACDSLRGQPCRAYVDR